MTDDEFKAAVLGRFDRIDGRLDRIDGRLDRMDVHFDAIIARLDEQDTAYDLLADKLDRLGSAVSASSRASEQALDAVVVLGRRVTRLEHPQGGN